MNGQRFMSRFAASRLRLWCIAIGAAGVAITGSACEQQASEGASGDRSAAAASSNGFIVQTVNYPLAYFAERIAGGHAEVRLLAPADGDPAFWLPDRESIVQLQSADLILDNGAGYAKWMGTVSLPTSKVADTSASFASAYIETEESVVHSHGEGGEHSHAGTAFTTWLDMTQARAQAEVIRDALSERLPDHADDFEANADALFADLDALDADLQAAGESLTGVPLAASHPVYQYLARRYSLSIEALHWEPEMTITDENLAELADLRSEHAAAWMVWEGEPSPEAIAALEGVGVSSVVFDPCGNRPDEGDWLSVMRANIQSLRSIAAGG